MPATAMVIGTYCHVCSKMLPFITRYTISNVIFIQIHMA